MTITGQMQNGVIVPDAPLPWADGVKVSISTAASLPPALDTPPGKIPTLAERFKDIIGIAEDLPEDFALNHDHYIHGTPKR